MKGFSGFGNSPAKQEDKQEKEKYDPSTDPYAKAQEDYEKSQADKYDANAEKEDEVYKQNLKDITGQ